MSNIPGVNRMINQQVAYEGTSNALKLSDRAGTALEKQMYDDFAEFNSGNPDIKTGESTASYRIKVGLLVPKLSEIQILQDITKHHMETNLLKLEMHL